MNPHYTVRRSGRHTLVKFRDSPPTAPRDVDRIGRDLLELSGEQPAGRLVLDCTHAAHLPSHVLSMILNLHHKLSTGPDGGRLVLCGLSHRLMHVMRITRLDSVLAILPSSRDAVPHRAKAATAR